VYQGASGNSADAQRDLVVAWCAYVLGLLQCLLNWPLRTWQAWLWEKREREPAYFNYVYVLEWAALLAAAWIGFGYTGRPFWGPLLAAVALWRSTELIVWYAKMLLDRTHHRFWSNERNLLFLFANSVEFVTASAVLLRVAQPSSSAIGAWIDGLSAFTLNGRPGNYSGAWADAAVLVTTLAGLVVIGAGLAIIVSLIAEKFEQGEGRAYTGPRRTPRPHGPKRRD
jgi:hypothetical protein